MWWERCGGKLAGELATELTGDLAGEVAAELVGCTFLVKKYIYGARVWGRGSGIAGRRGGGGGGGRAGRMYVVN